MAKLVYKNKGICNNNSMHRKNIILLKLFPGMGWQFSLFITIVDVSWHDSAYALFLFDEEMLIFDQVIGQKASKYTKHSIYGHTFFGHNSAIF